MSFRRVIAAFDGSPQGDVGPQARRSDAAARSYGPMHRAPVASVSEALTEGALHPVLVVPLCPVDRGEQSATPKALEAR